MKRFPLATVATLFFLTLSTSLFAFQQVRRDTLAAADTLQTILEMNVEDLLEQSTQDVEDSELVDRLQRLQEDPMDLNDASIEDLQLIPGVMPIVARNIVEARERFGEFKYVSDLLAVDGIDERLFALLKRFVQVSQSVPTKLAVHYRSRAARDLEERQGFRDGSYVGSPWKSYNRILGKYGSSASAGILTEKDAGENKVNDFTSGFLTIKTRGPLTKLILGDYLVELGQGLTVWRSLGFSKGLEVIQPAKKSARGITPNVSSDENNFYRGGAAVVTLALFEATLFYSNRKVDASVDSLGRVTNIYGIGYHRTQSELRRRFATRERSAGGRLQYSLGKVLRLGSTYFTTKFNNPFVEKRLYDFSGKESHVASIDFDFLWDRMNIFGEWARSQTGAVGGITGVFVRFARGVDFVVSFRNYPRDFISLHGFAFGERNGTTRNEAGLYMGLRMRVARGVVLSGYYDQFKFPWQTATIPFPIQGSDFLLAAELRPFQKFNIEFKYKSEVKGDAVSTTDEFGRTVAPLTDRTQRNGRLTAALDITRDLRVRGRLELVKVQYSEFASCGKGILLYQDIRWEPSPRLTLDARLIFFDTDSYDTRIYEFESELRGTLFNPALYGRGRRWYLMARYAVFEGLEVSAKYSEIYHDDLKKVGSGADEINGNVENRFGAQVDIRF
ncbi:MAG: helix-hairpin-helix domain-containing protein [Bacteroidota bacterium]